MRALLLVLALLVAAVVAPVVAPVGALAAGPAPAADEEVGDAARQVDTPNLVAPVVRNGQLRNYLYITVRVRTPDGVDAFALRDKGHILRDAFLRASHRNDLADPQRDDLMNMARASEVFSQVARGVLGAANVADIQLLNFSSLRREDRRHNR